MELIPAKSWKLEFARSVEAERYREITRRVMNEAAKKEKDEDRKEAEAQTEEFMAFAVMASEPEIAEFTVDLDHFDTAEVEALQDNERALTTARHDREDIVAKAYKLPDGTMVFESEDGVRVLTADGKEVPPSVIAAGEIEDSRPKYETFVKIDNEVDALEQERAALLKYQTELDDAREAVKDGKISEAELSELKKHLAQDMPDSVRENLAPQDCPHIETTSDADVAPADAGPIRPGGNLAKLTF